MNLSYVSAGLALLLVGFSGRLYVVSVNNARVRTEIQEFQQVDESTRNQLLAKRQQLQSQQEKIAKAAKISESVGPAVVADIVAAAEKNNNPRLKELLQKYGVAEAAGAARKGGN